MIRLGIIGAGTIVPYHIEAAKMAGFEPIVICGKDDSVRAQSLSAKHKSMKYARTVEDLLQLETDAILIASSTEANVGLIKKCLSKGNPILVEKPVSLSVMEIEELDEFDTSRVIVGYNRRHYSSVVSFKSQISNIDCGLVQVNIPELSWDYKSNSEIRQLMLFENATHVLDLVAYLFGPIELLHINKQTDLHGTKYCLANFRSNLGFIGTISLGYGTPENLSIKCWSSGLNLELNPLEILNECNELDMIPANSEWPVKRYQKKYLNRWKIDENDVHAKPGFLSQFQELKTLVVNSEVNLKSATLIDAKNALLLASQLS